MENEELVTEEVLTKRKSHKRLFVAFLIVDVLLIALVIYQIYLLAVN